MTLTMTLMMTLLELTLTRMGSKNGKPVLREEDVASLVTTSGMTAQEVRDAFTGFLAEHPNGKMKPKDFRKLISSALPKKDAAKMEKHVFRIYDENGDGHVNFVEFMVSYTGSLISPTVSLTPRSSTPSWPVETLRTFSRRSSGCLTSTATAASARRR